MPRDEVPLVIARSVSGSSGTERGSTLLVHASAMTGEQSSADDIATTTTITATEAKTCGVTVVHNAGRCTCLSGVPMLGHKDVAINLNRLVRKVSIIVRFADWHG